MIRAVIVDFDDTLCLTEQATFELENDALQQMNRPPQQREVHLRTWGQPLYEAIKERSPGVDVQAFRRILTKTHMQWVKEKRIDALAPENLHALDQLLAAGKEVFVLTSRSHGEILHLLEPDHELATRVKAFYYRDTMSHHKPDPRAFDNLLKENQLKPEECVYIGDSLTDAQAAKGARVHFVACLEAGLRTKQDFSAEAVDVFTKRFADTAAAVHQIDAQTTI